MRELKFKLWGNRTKRMSPSAENIETIIEYCLMAKTIPDATWLQFTGLKDKNGKEIYEGDVVGFYAYHSSMADGDAEWDGGRIIIEWDTNKARFKTPFSETENIPVQLAQESFEVIGNIYENPELIK